MVQWIMSRLIYPLCADWHIIPDLSTKLMKLLEKVDTAGGGRYDHLVQKLANNVDMPACGFAIGDMTLSDCWIPKDFYPSMFCSRHFLDLRR